MSSQQVHSQKKAAADQMEKEPSKQNFASKKRTAAQITRGTINQLENVPSKSLKVNKKVNDVMPMCQHTSKGGKSGKLLSGSAAHKMPKKKTFLASQQNRTAFAYIDVNLASFSVDQPKIEQTKGNSLVDSSCQGKPTKNNKQQCSGK